MQEVHIGRNCVSLFTLSAVLEAASGKTELLRIILVKLYRVVIPGFHIAFKSLLWSIVTETDFFFFNPTGKCSSSYGTSRSLKFVSINFTVSEGRTFSLFFFGSLFPTQSHIC